MMSQEMAEPMRMVGQRRTATIGRKKWMVGEKDSHHWLKEADGRREGQPPSECSCYRIRSPPDYGTEEYCKQEGSSQVIVD